MELLQFTSPAFLSSDELTMDSLAVIWLLVTASVATLALCQYTLSWHDHRILRAHRELARLRFFGYKLERYERGAPHGDDFRIQGEDRGH